MTTQTMLPVPDDKVAEASVVQTTEPVEEGHGQKVLSTPADATGESALHYPRTAFDVTERVPAEILVEIFMLIMLHGVETMSNSWMFITHVSARWRDIALQSPLLWSWPSFRNLPCAEAMLSRAAHMPLNIVINFSRFHKSHAIWKGFASLPRAQSLTMHSLISPDHWEFFDEHLKGRSLSAPALHSLTINAVTHRSKELSEGFKLACPQLRHLTLRNRGLDGLPVDLASLPMLTTLEIRSSGRQSKNRVRMGDLLTALPHLGQLQDLRLYDAFLPYHLPSIKSPIELATLKNVVVEDTPQMCRVFFESITYPNHGVNVSISCLSGLEDDSNYDAAAGNIKTLLLNTSHRLQPIRTLHILPTQSAYSSANSPCSLSFWTTPHLDDLSYADEPSPLTIIAPFLRKIFVDFCDLLPMQDLQHLVYHVDASHNFMWKDFGRLKHLSLIDIRNPHYAFLRVLMSPWEGELKKAHKAKGSKKLEAPPPDSAPATEEKSRPPRYFKALRDLTLDHDWVFENYKHSWICPSTFAKGIAKRREHGCGLSHLQLAGCDGFRYEDLESLLEVVDEVYWDGEDPIIEPIIDDPGEGVKESTVE